MQQPSQKSQLSARQSKGNSPVKAHVNRKNSNSDKQKPSTTPLKNIKTTASSVTNVALAPSQQNPHSGAKPVQLPAKVPLNTQQQQRFQSPSAPLSTIVNPCRLFVKAEIYSSLSAMQSRSNSTAALNILVSLSSDARVSTLLRKIEADYRRKTQGARSIRAHQVLVQDCFEIVDVVRSQVSAYLTDMMHVTVLAVETVNAPGNIAQAPAAPVTASVSNQVALKPVAAQKEVKAPVTEKVKAEAPSVQKQPTKTKAPTPAKANKKEPTPAVKVQTPSKKRLSSSISISSLSEKAPEPEVKKAKQAKKASLSDSESKQEESSSDNEEEIELKKTAKAAKEPTKRAKADSIAETAAAPKPKKVSADQATTEPAAEERKESKNQRRKRERKEQNKLKGKQDKASGKLAVGTPADKTETVAATPLLNKQVSKDGKIKSKNFNLFAQFEGDKKAPVTKTPSSHKDSSDSDFSDVDDNESEVSDKLKKQIADSINSYSLEKASNDGGDKQEPQEKNGKTSAAKKEAPQKPSFNDDISSFSDSC